MSFHIGKGCCNIWNHRGDQTGSGCGLPPLTLSRMILIFLLASFLGNLVETLFCGILEGTWGSRRGVVYGPFSPIYGMGALLLLLTRPLRQRSLLLHFLAAAFIGGAFEVAGGYLEATFLHGVSWYYSGWTIPLFGGRTSVLFMVLWGVAAVFWVRWAYPRLMGLLGGIPPRPTRIIAGVLGILMAANLAISTLALKRWSDRVTLQRPAATQLDVLLDRHYPNPRMEKLFSNLYFISAAKGNQGPRA